MPGAHTGVTLTRAQDPKGTTLRLTALHKEDCLDGRKKVEVECGYPLQRGGIKPEWVNGTKIHLFSSEKPGKICVS